MDRQTATKLIKSTFENPFDKARFINFGKNLVNHLDESNNFLWAGNRIPNAGAFQPYINSIERVGKYNDGENKIDVLIVNLKREQSLEHARTRQRNFVARYLDEHKKSAALVAFVSPDPDDWRFSLVKMEYSLGTTPTGRIKTEIELTPARRYSFLVGKNESSHTAQNQFLSILQNDTQNPSLAEFEKAFSVEVVTREFFTKYKELFGDVEEALQRLANRDERVKAEFTTKNIDIANFAKKLLGQIVFLYFLQKKGWLGVPEDRKWGDGDRRFLRTLFDRASNSKANFFNGYLEYLFYDALAKQERGTIDPAYYPSFNCKIPFLNGGLFDPINGYSWDHTDILLPNELFSNTEKTKEGDTGTGILDVFDRYNFTVKEDEPLDKEVAVDPEMLGKVFENLLEVKDRKSKGTYYTPREIVHYMCQESLINYLDTAVNTGEVPLAKEKPVNLKLFGAPAVQQQALKTEGNTNRVPREDIEALIRLGDTAIEHDATAVRKQNEIEQGKIKTTLYGIKLRNIAENARLIDDALANIRVCDPAIGSGAFPVGMMTEIVRARRTLSTYLPDDKERTNYHFKRHAIQYCLYGVDIDPGAVEIAKLRLWLSLVVDEDDIKQIQPLPNLDYKIVCGNSLLGVERRIENWQLFAELERLKPLHFNETNNKKKQEYKKQIDQLIMQLTDDKKVFDFEIYFSEVFHEKSGFDVVIANPPYVSYGLRGAQTMTSMEKDSLKRNYPDSAEYKISLYAIFMNKAIQLARVDGIQTLIVPDSFLVGRYFSKIRKLILNKNKILELVLLPYGVFDAVVGFSVVYLFQRVDTPDTSHNLVARFIDSKDNIVNRTLKSFSYPQAYFKKIPYNRFRLFFSPIAKKFVDAVEAKSIPLNRVARITTGVRSKIGQDKIKSLACIGPKWKKGIVSGSQVSKYKVEWKGHYLNIDGNLLFAGGWDESIIEKPKIMIRQTGDTIIAGIDRDKLYHLNNVHSLHLIAPNLSLFYVCALLNSRLINRYYHLVSLEYKRTMAQTDIETLELLPFREPDSAVLKNVNSLLSNIDVTDSLDAIEKILEKVYGLDLDLVNYLTEDEFYPEC